MQALLTEWLYCLKQYLRICLFSASPSDLPPSVNSVMLTLLAYLLVGIFILGEQHGVITVLAHIVIEVGILFTLSHLLLRYRKLSPRLLQTLSALVGSSLIVSVASIPFSYLLASPGAAAEPDPLAMQVNLALLFWNLAVISLIFKRAFEISTVLAGFLAFNYFLLYELLVINLLQ